MFGNDEDEVFSEPFRSYSDADLWFYGP